MNPVPAVGKEFGEFATAAAPRQGTAGDLGVGHVDRSPGVSQLPPHRETAAADPGLRTVAATDQGGLQGAVLQRESQRGPMQQAAEDILHDVHDVVTGNADGRDRTTNSSRTVSPEKRRVGRPKKG